ncbi:MAG: YegS/Rv2252/BmrU family lipid kinase [Lachnospiraceae bacterium]|nr:YegS/Rv2252/BmrU family lipid kinase [Lachnospiraceae bacterium]
MYHMIVNPSSKSGFGMRKWKELKSLFLKKMVTYNVQFTSGPMDTYKCIRKLTGGSFTLPLKIVVLGGDGTLNEVLNGIQDFENTVLTFLPTGSSNDLARDLKRTSDPEELLEHLSDSSPFEMDFGAVRYKGGKRRFIVSSGIGFDAAVCEESLHSTLKKVLNLFRLGKLTYGMIALKLLIQAKPVSCDLWLDDSDTPIHFDRMLFCAAMNHKYEGGGFMFSPEADDADGYLDICLAANLSKWRVPFLLPLAMKGKHVGKQGIYNYRAKKIRIKTSSPLPVHTDGEICGHFDSLELTCEEKKLKFL